MKKPRSTVARKRARRLVLALAASLPILAPAGCKPSGQKTQLGPFELERYEAAAADGARIDCFVFGAESNKPVRLCGAGSPIPGFAGVLFHAQQPAEDSKFVAAFGAPEAPGDYLLKPLSGTTVDAWPLGALGTHEWLGGGKVLLDVETGADHRTRVRLIDPAGRSERTFDAGVTRGNSWLLVRADDDAAVLLVQRLGGEELIAVRDPLRDAEVTVADASDEKSPGNRKLFHRGDIERQGGGTFKPGPGVTTDLKWEKGGWTFQGAPLGPFTAPAK